MSNTAIGSPTGNAALYLGIAAQLHQRVYNTPPPGYIWRLSALWALCAINFALALLHMSLTVRDIYRRGKTLGLVRIQTLRHGRILVFNSLFLYVMCSAASALYLAIVRYRHFLVYYRGHKPYGLTLLILHQWTAIFAAGFVFTSGNCAALILTAGKSDGFRTTPRSWIVAVNVAYVLHGLWYLGIIVPIGVIVNGKVDAIYRKSLTAMDSLQRAATGNAVLDPPLPQFLQELAALASSAADLTTWFRVLMGLAIASCTLVAVASVISLSLVMKLKHHYKSVVTIQREGAAGPAIAGGAAVPPAPAQWPRVAAVTLPSPVRAHYAGQTKPVRPAPLATPPAAQPLSPMSPRTFPRSAATALTRMSTVNDHGIALRRLANDLSLAVPLVLAASIVLPFVSFWAFFPKNERWLEKEFQIDGLAWAYLLMQIALLSYFVANIIMNPSKYHERYATSNEAAFGGSSGRDKRSKSTKGKRRGVHTLSMEADSSRTGTDFSGAMEEFELRITARGGLASPATLSAPTYSAPATLSEDCEDQEDAKGGVKLDVPDDVSQEAYSGKSETGRAL